MGNPLWRGSILPKVKTFPSAFGGGDYKAAVAEIAAYAVAVNGKVEQPDESGEPTEYARLTCGQAVAIFMGIVRALARSTIKLSEYDWELCWLAMGWRQDGDRFKTTKEHALSAFPVESLSVFWDFCEDAGTHLDTSAAKRAPIFCNFTMAGYEEGLRQAWQAMKRIRGEATPVALVEHTTDLIPPIPKVPPELEEPAKGPSVDGSWLWLLLLLAIGAGSRRRKA